MVQSILGLLAQKISWGSKLQVKDPAAVPYSIDFSVAANPNPFTIDLSTTQFKNIIGDVRTLFVDNSNNTATLNILNAVTQQNVEIPAGCQAYMPVVSLHSGAKFQISTSGAALVGFDFLNVQIPPFIWNAAPSTTVIGSVLFAGSAGIDHSGNALTYPPTGHSKLISIAANTSRALIGVQNQSADQVQAWRTAESGGNTCILLESGGQANSGGGAWTSQTYKGSLEVWAPTANIATDQVAAYED